MAKKNVAAPPRGWTALEVVARGEVALIGLARPKVHNAFDEVLIAELTEAVRQAGEDPAVRVIVVHGTGTSFCAGADLDWMKRMAAYGHAENLADAKALAAMLSTIAGCPKPTVAAVNGPAYGGGMCLALGADLRFAGESATFNATGIVNGLTSTEMGASWLLPRLIGVARSNDLLLTGRAVDAAEALAMGLVSRVLPDDELLDSCLEVAASMTRFSPYGLTMTKDVLWANLEVASLEAAVELEDRNQLMLGFTENLPEAIRAFDAGRDPVYTDEPRRGMFPE